MRLRRIVLGIIVVAVLIASPLSGVSAGAAPSDGRGQGGGGPAAYWTAERRQAAQPRDLVIDHRGLGYLRRADGTLVPHGHSVAAAPGPNARPSGGGSGSTDTTPPDITLLTPAAGATIGASATFSAAVTDDSGVRSVTFRVTNAGGNSWSFAGTKGGGDTWSVALQGFTDGDWTWSVTATDAAKRGGNSDTTPERSFIVDTGGGGGGGGTGDVVTNAEWTSGGAVQTAAGRIYFEMPTNRRATNWAGYVCSGTVATEAAGDRSVIITAAHCVYDDVSKTFARNVIFIPDQAWSGTRTDLDCSNDHYGCWAPSVGVVDTNWTTRRFPDNVAWDYAYYVVPDTDAHTGTTSHGALDGTVGSLDVDFTAPTVGDPTHALGYSYSEDPNFMYCAEDLTELDAVNWWLPNCGLSGGSSGGPWVQPMDEGTGAGPIISVNSWGYTNSPGMAGPKLAGTSAGCLFGLATAPTTALSDPDRGVHATC